MFAFLNFSKSLMLSVPEEIYPDPKCVRKKIGIAGIQKKFLAGFRVVK
jgi:hypothetical protein